jgi:hypothetical protein
MYSDRSTTHIVSQWNDTEHSHFCCWDCAFRFQHENGLTPTLTLVVRQAEDVSNPDWLEAEDAFYLFGTSRLTGSMPPFVAAFPTQDAALTAKSELGGELVNWPELQARFTAQHSAAAK